MPYLTTLVLVGIPYSQLPFDCTGTCKNSPSGATAYINPCGFCVDGSSGLNADAGMDALYVILSSNLMSVFIFFSCISGNCSGTAQKDRCGIIYGGTSGRVQTPNQDPCPPIVFPVGKRRASNSIPLTVQPCFMASNGVLFYPDCAGVCNGTAYINPCKNCVGGTTGEPADFGVDCVGICGGSAILDECGVCSGGSTHIKVCPPTTTCF